MSQMSKLRNSLLALVLVVTFLVPVIAQAAPLESQVPLPNEPVRSGWAPAQASLEIQADTFGMPLAADEFAQMYAKPSVLLQQGDEVTFKADIPADGLYTVSFDMLAAGSPLVKPEGQLTVDGVF